MISEVFFALKLLFRSLNFSTNPVIAKVIGGINEEASQADNKAKSIGILKLLSCYFCEDYNLNLQCFNVLYKFIDSLFFE